MSHDPSPKRTLDVSRVGTFDCSYLLQRVRSAMGPQYRSKNAFEMACRIMMTLWSALNCSVLENDMYEALLLLWPTFLKKGVLFMASDSPLLCARSLLEPLVMSASSTSVKDVASISEANTACIDEIVQMLISELRQRTTTLSSLVPPLGLLQELMGIIELLQEHHLTGGNNTFPTAKIELVDAYNSLVERYSSRFVEEVAFPSYWNLDWSASSSCFLLNGVHPTIYFCFTSLVGLVEWCGYPIQTVDYMPCRQIVAHVWERSALAIAAVAEEKEIGEARKKQLQVDTMHLVLFARMFRKFLGERFSTEVSSALVRLLGTVARHLCLETRTGISAQSVTAAFETNIWNVPPIEPAEWIQCVRAKGCKRKTNAFIPWNEEFIRASNVKAAQNPPEGWQSISFQHL
ncbi:hypothetical protein MOQ_006341 [Trypanosoma cruzi marinkellei]|uniref:Uncharacterized protein n=1 Tax=Trypanosoma cruzi marinkellei TaxID=85056 RepID=K2NLU4_TRYCR|nr:hypothetical protein MOQ_006341 [Trypanosoma cruzi marinkellei]